MKKTKFKYKLSRADLFLIAVLCSTILLYIPTLIFGWKVIGSVLAFWWTPLVPVALCLEVMPKSRVSKWLTKIVL